MMLSQIRVALVLPLAFGCAHPVYDNQPTGDDTGNSLSSEQPVSTAGGSSNNVVNSLPGVGDVDSGSAGAGSGEVELGGAPSSVGGQTGAAGKSASAGASSSSAGSTASASAGSAAGGATGSAGSHNSSGGAASAGAANGGSASGGTSSASGGSSSAGASSAGSTSTGCTGVPTWALGTYKAGDQVQSKGKLYACKVYPYTGWCGVSDAYAAGVGYAWMDAWDLVGGC